MITLAQVVEWLAWGFFMSIGWSLGSWIVSLILRKA